MTNRHHGAAGGWTTTVVCMVAVVVVSWFFPSERPGAEPSEQAVVIAETVAVYMQTSERSQVVGSLRRGARLTIDMTLRGSDGEWCQVRPDAAPTPLGFVRCAALDRIPTSSSSPPLSAPRPAPAAESSPNRALRGTGELHVLPLGPLPTVSLPHLVSYYRAKFGLDLTLLPPMALDGAVANPARGQLVAERVLEAIHRTHANLLQRRRTAVVAITEYDMYTLRVPDWVFAFSSRDGRVAVVSAARMNPQNLGDRPDVDLMHARLRKMVTKNIGVLYLGVAQSPNPRSVMFNNILGIEELDRMGEDF